MNQYTRNLNRIEFVVTNACTGRCKHCSEGDHIDLLGCIDKNLAIRALSDVCEEYKIESVMTFGGEPLLYSDVVLAIQSKAKELGIEHRQLITNGYFSKDKTIITDVVRELKQSGVNDLLLSADSFHQETIPLYIVKFFAEKAVEANLNIRLSPAWLVSREDNNPYNIKTREILSEFSQLNIEVGMGNVIFPSGNAIKYLKEYFDGASDAVNPYEDNPNDIRSIGFMPDGKVLNDNINNKGILDILDNYQP